jgi:glycine cleavage system aminomethyltransferase T
MTAATQAFDFTRLTRDYGDVDAEVAACREKAALFDFSFMSAARVSGHYALKAIARITERRLDDMTPGRIRYALSCGPNGWLRSDLTIWNEGNDHYILISGCPDDVADLVDLARTMGKDCSVEDLSDATAVLSVQGPKALHALDGLVDRERLRGLSYFGFAAFDIDGIPCLIGRLGYTGERGFEIILPAELRAKLWQQLARRAQSAGFDAADCLRIEAGFVLFANEFRLPVTAKDAGLEPFGGNDAAPPRFRLICFRAETKEPPVLWQPSQDLVAPNSGFIAIT